MARVKANANFYSFSGSSAPEITTDIYKEYRRCWIDYPERFFLRDFPMHLDVEITNRCNLRCTFCDKMFSVSSGIYGDMDLGLFKNIVDEGVSNNLWGLKLSYRGEPLLHKNVIDMVRYAKQKGVLDVYFNTNGMLLDRHICEGLIDAGLDRISVSVDGIDPVIFEKERVGAKFDVILNNINTLIRIRDNWKANHPKVRVQTVYFPGLDIKAYKEFWLSRCDEVAAVDYKEGAKRITGIKEDWSCPQLWQRMTIQWDGKIMPCNNDDGCLLSPGNIKDKSVFECWHDKKIEEIRVIHRQGNSHIIEACDGCPWRTAQINKLRGVKHAG